MSNSKFKFRNGGIFLPRIWVIGLIVIVTLRLAFAVYNIRYEFEANREKQNKLLDKLEAEYGVLQYYSKQLINQQGSHIPTNQILDLEDFPRLVGPRTDPLDTSKTLVLLIASGAEKQKITKTITNFFNNTELYTIMIFHSDSQSFDDEEWYNRLNVVSIRVSHKLKFWFIKRFVPPFMAASFSFIAIIDAEVEFSDNFNAQEYYKVIDSYKIALSQPTHKLRSYTQSSLLHSDKKGQIGRYTQYIAPGPVVWISSAAYQCVYNLFQTDLTTGFGLDQLWGGYIIDVCGFGPSSVAVLDSFLITLPTPPADHKNFDKLVATETKEYLKRFGHETEPILPSDAKYVPFGDITCLSFPNPAKCK